MSSNEVIRRLTANGWIFSRSKGSHHHYKHPSNPNIVTVPHARKDIPKGTLKSIERASGVSME